MDTRRTGDGKLSRKLLTILVLAAMPISGMSVAAGTAATGPNSVYIEQVGNSNVITIEQVGGTNTVGGVTSTISVDGTGTTTMLASAPSSLNYGTVAGVQNTIGITQHGNANSAQYNVFGDRNTYTSTVTGNANQTNLLMGDGQNNVKTTNSNVTETIVGNSNTVIQKLVGDNINSTTSITGNSNQFTNNQLSTNGSLNNTVVGDYNVINSQQTDSAGANGHILVMNTAGDYNSITTQQQGFNDTTVNISTTGSHNTITVRSSSSAIASPVSAIVR